MRLEDDRSNYLKIEDAARLLGVSRRWVYRRIWKGELPASKVGGLYFIRPEDLQALIAQGQTAISGETFDLETGLTSIKCGYCFRLLTTDQQIGEVCETTGCERLICTRCLSEGLQHCVQHAPSSEQKWEQAVERHQRGELPLLVRASTARLRELNYLNRIQTRLARINSLIHPLSGEVLTIQDWDACLEQEDERAEVMQLLGRVVLDNDMFARVPLNASLRYRIAPQKKQKGLPLDISAQVLSRLPVMLRDDFDTQPLYGDDLTPWLVQLSEQAQHSQTIHLAVLASTTGWDTTARNIVLGEVGRPRGTAYSHRLLLIYLFDLESGELFYNLQDDRLRRYAVLFAPLLPSEEIEEVIGDIEKQLLAYESLTLEYAAEILPYTRSLLQQAFERMVATSRYTLTDVPGLGLTIVRKTS